jgi:hypothetical protein
MKTFIGCFLLLVGAATGFQGYTEFAFYAALFGVAVLLSSQSKSDSSIEIGFGDGDGGDSGGGCGGD